MMLALKLAIRNIRGAGLRTLLNAIVLSFSFIVIVFFQGYIKGWDHQARNDSISMEYGYGFLSHEEYDRYDPFTIVDAHGTLLDYSETELTPVLIRQASIFPDGRMVPVLLKGMDPNQSIVNIPLNSLAENQNEIPVMIGNRMAEMSGLTTGEKVLLRWRDANGTFDAREATVVGIFESNVPTIDKGQLYLPIELLRDLTGLDSESTYFIAGQNYDHSQIDGWKFEDQGVLLKEYDEMIASKYIGNAVVYILLLAIALLAIFDTQVLSVFRRQREIGTYISLGMTRRQVMWLFTIEGTLYSVLGVIIGSVVGAPLFIYLSVNGIPLPGMQEMGDDMGISMTEKVIPVYGITLIIATSLLIIASSTFVSYLPSRKIALMDPVDALKGKLQ